MTDWQKEFGNVGAYWLHDGNPLRPYARLTSGLISNVFFNGGKIASEHPQLLNMASFDLAAKASIELGGERDWRCIGPAKGAITLSHHIAATGGYRHAWADKEGDSFAIDDRFTTFFQANERVILVEDTITTGGSLVRLRDAVLAVSPATEFAAFVLALCNRSGKLELWPGTRIISLVEPAASAWKEGDNPFTQDGRETMPPVRPKTHWNELTRSYE